MQSHLSWYLPRNSFRSVISPSILLLAIAISLCACSRQKQTVEYSIFAFGTLIDITLFDVDPEQAENAFAQLQQHFDNYHQAWSPWTNGDLAQLNQKLASSSANEHITIPAHLVPLIRQSQQLSNQSNGLFNPAIGKLINLWQFHRYQEEDIQPPSPAEIEALVKQSPSMADLSLLENNQLQNANPAVQLNFGAFAKGYAIKLEIEFLRSLGIDNAIINAGGDLSVIGKKGERQWNIGIRNPRPTRPEDEIFASIEVTSGESVFTSGDYERFYVFNRRRFHHILDASTGYPTEGAQSVTVLHNDAAIADAAATALMVAGGQHWNQIARNMGINHVMLIDGDGQIQMTDAMRDRVKLLK